MQLRKLVNDSENDILEKEALSAVEGAHTHPKKESFVTLLLRNHDRLKASVDDLVSGITSGTFEVHQILNQFEIGRVKIQL